ncbi:MAG TPA: heparan N-sulfatase, partial [Planctomycetaceae bacterium]|nr:heparan N-sulfatase [Planctomycetaceae bacterium]
MSRFCLFIPVVFGFWASAVGAESSERPPNIFIAISDDVSFPHAGAYGSRMVHTPAFDRTAASGALFRNAFCAAPGCSPSR